MMRVETWYISNSKSALEQESNTLIQLPPHYRCTSHTLDLIANSDVDKIINTNSSFKKLYTKILWKCSAMWSKQNISLLATEKIHGT